MIATCLHMLKGSPYIYQGEEMGMTNAYFKSIDDYRDIEAIMHTKSIQSGLMTEEEMLNCLKMVSRDNARTPMQWDDSANAGFTTENPWISVNKNYTQINAKGSTGRQGQCILLLSETDPAASTRMSYRRRCIPRTAGRQR